MNDDLNAEGSDGKEPCSYIEGLPQVCQESDGCKDEEDTDEERTDVPSTVVVVAGAEAHEDWDHHVVDRVEECRKQQAQVLAQPGKPVAEKEITVYFAFSHVFHL